MTNNNYNGKEIAILVPCYNEEIAVEKVIEDFRRVIPEAKIYIFDNNSSDKTSEVARNAGAIVKFVELKGKGNVVRRMFADVEADIYIMTDGDATYDADSVHLLIDKLLDEDLDMVVGCRVEESKENENYRAGHRFGNMMLTGTVMKIFGGNFTDMLSGYRAFSRRYVKSFPALAEGFETETELTVHALELRMPYGEISTPYFERPEGSESKLSTYKDGWRILKTIIKLYANERPTIFFGLIGLLMLIISSIIMIPIILTYLSTHEVPKFPTLILAVSLATTGILSIAVGLILNTVTRGRHEMKRLFYLSIPNSSKKDI
mgnify:FL=1|jgi:glycosyltransferase involved in cell wall biosynthesis